MKKLINLLSMVCIVALAAFGQTDMALGSSFIYGAYNMPQIPGIAYIGIDVAALANTLVEFGGTVILKEVNKWDPSVDFMISKNVQMPVPLPKLSSIGEPRPYRAAQDVTGNGVALTDRVLTVHQSKWDHNFDPEVYRNTYLAEIGGNFDPNNLQFWNYLAAKLAVDYLASINDHAMLDGVYNASGTGAVDLMDGLIQIINGLPNTPVGTGAITALNAVTKTEMLAAAVPVWMRNAGFKIICSYQVFDFYKTHYRSMNPFGFAQASSTSFKLDGYSNATLEPRSYMKSTLGIFAIPAVKKNLWLGTDGDSVRIHATPKLNTIDLRLMMPIGMQIADPDAIVINDMF